MAQAFSIEKTVREARTFEKAQEIAAELRKGGEYKAFINLDAPFSITKDNYDENSKFIGESKYIVDLTALPVPTCTCPDFTERGGYCKHIWGVQIALDMDAQEEAQCREYEEEQARLEPYGYFSH